MIDDVVRGLKAFVAELENEYASGKDDAEVIKEQLLKDYANKQPAAFYQVDGYCDWPEGHSACSPDADGHALFKCSRTHELIDGANVRVLIEDGTSKADALKLLDKIRGVVESYDGDTFDLTSPEWRALLERKRYADAQRRAAEQEASMPF
jgi:hypothetical protein